ncbi:hypothetical protein VTJ49DRAFT_3246 [Mycothermus thermophilus]|uniref:Pyroglutamyl peptidase type I n=1 Tax=Humicola insolens TaxID=85995 RepID=A0ABR3V910_HUMIN
MGSIAASDRDGSEKPINVLITGFAPFKRDYPVNPSWEIARSLPDWLPPLRAKTATTTSTSSPPPVEIPPVRLLTHPAPIRVNYKTVRALVPRLWDGDGDAPSSGGEKEEDKRPQIDLALHIGMAGPRLFYSIERRGHREGYKMQDVDGEYLSDRPEEEEEEDDDLPEEEDGERGGEEEGERRKKRWIWAGLPKELLSDLDVEDVLRRWRGHSPKHMDLRISEDAGRYLCDFIYFSSLAHLYKAGRRRSVLFLHVPSDASEHSVAVGRELVLQLVRAMVESEVERRRRDEVGE